MIKHFPEKTLYLYGGFLRDRLTETIHDRRIKISDYNFMISDDIFDDFKKILISKKDHF